MLNNKRLTMVADATVGDAKIAIFGAILNLDNMDMSFSNRYIDKDACKVYKDVVRADQAEFEDYAYEIQERVMAMTVNNEEGV